jgi:Na+-transporting methylmalonyl-CoA/oxaloacetate decarboxylase gamma subunit
MGMGGVFLALVCLYLFTSGLSFASTRRRSGEAKRPGAKTAEAKQDKQHDDSGDALAAAIAVAITLQSQDRSAPVQLSIPGQGTNPWKLAGRAGLMQHLRHRKR